jgi:hypothetical protein
MTTYPEQDIMITPGMFETRTVYNVKPHTPNRFTESGHDGCTDETGIISLCGKRVGVETGYWGDVLVWQLVRSGPTWPHCDDCRAPLDIGMLMEWQCPMCEQERRRELVAQRITAQEA